MKLKFLGTADSAGIPVHNCTCSICNEYRGNNMNNLSTCAYLEIEDKVILIDAGIEDISNIFDMKKISAIFLTHFHADHCMGLLRLRHSNDKINCYHPKDKDGFSDLFKHKYSLLYNELEPFSETIINEIKFTTIPLKHSKNTFGYLIEYKNNKIAYLTDCSGISKTSMEFLKSFSLDYAFIDACYDERKETGNHLNYVQASEILDELEVKNASLMHISHTTAAYIKENNVFLKYKYLKKNNVFII